MLFEADKIKSDHETLKMCIELNVNVRMLYILTREEPVMNIVVTEKNQ